MPESGRLSLTSMLSEKGRVIGDFTICGLSENEFRLTARYGEQTFHLRWFDRHPDKGVNIKNISDRCTGFQIAGPKARALRTDVSTHAFRLTDARRIRVGMCAAIV